MREKKEYAFRVSTLHERRRFYEQEFSLAKVVRWFRKHHLPLPQLCALDPGTDSRVMKKVAWDNTLFYIRFDELPKKVLQYLPEDVYYDRNVYENAEEALRTLRFSGHHKQELAFDVDANNIPCVHADEQTICERCLSIAHAAAQKIVKRVHSRFQKIALVYSGRGFHIHIFDAKARKMPFEERAALAKKFERFPIDPWVTRGYIRLLRLPWTLNGVVSRIAIPLTTPTDTSYRIRSLPKFLQHLQRY